MTDIIKVAILDNEKKKVIFVGLRQDRTRYFAVVLKRKRITSPEEYWTLYISVTPEQYEVLHEIDESGFYSFIGISSEPINVPPHIVDSQLMDEPTHFVGWHMHTSAIASMEDGIALIQQHSIRLSEIFRNHNANGSPVSNSSF